jgi:hypothetical protein
MTTTIDKSKDSPATDIEFEAILSKATWIVCTHCENGNVIMRIYYGRESYHDFEVARHHAMTSIGRMRQSFCDNCTAEINYVFRK